MTLESLYMGCTNLPGRWRGEGGGGGGGGGDRIAARGLTSSQIRLYYTLICTDEEDFESQGGTITFVPGGAKSLPVDIPITDDTNPEPNEPFMVIFSSMDLPPGMQDVLAPNVTIIDNEISK